jgi:uncharacterized protein YndB with AHSA1/START domain
MKIIQWTLAVVGAVVLLLLAGGFFISSAFKVERSVVINAPAKKVYDLVVEPKKWQEWSAWNKRDPNMKITYKGPPFGMGARWDWVSKTEGTGSMEFTRVEPDRAVEYSLSFPEYKMTSTGAITLEPSGNATKVTWTNAGDVGKNPLKHYLTLVMDRMVGPDFETGLANLKAIAEKP